MKNFQIKAAVLALALGSFASAGLAAGLSRSEPALAAVQQDLSTVLSGVIDGLPVTSDDATYEAQLAGAIESSGANCEQAELALKTVRGRTGLTPAALKAIQSLLETVDQNGCRLRVGSVNTGGAGAAAFGSGLSFGGGGGGSDYTPL